MEPSYRGALAGPSELGILWGKDRSRDLRLDLCQISGGFLPMEFRSQSSAVLSDKAALLMDELTVMWV